MIIYVDIDNTICLTRGTQYAEAVPLVDRITKVNGWYDAGHTIIYWTARGTGSGLDYMHLTLQQLSDWGCKYHQVKMNKPVYDLFIDDKSAFFELTPLPEELMDEN